MAQIPALLICAALVLPACSGAETNTAPSGPAMQITGATKQIPFRDVIESTTHHRVLNFETNNPVHVKLRENLLRAAALAGRQAAKAGLDAARPNEAGNYLEPFVRSALHEVGLDARIPQNSNGNAQSAGYPDIEIAGPVPCYLELKTYNASTANTTQRTFYYSPSAQPKVTHDALHFLLGYELEKQTRDGKTVFVPVHWKLITLENLVVDLKLEFNQSNRGLYGPAAGKALLAEGVVE
ncbi:MAG TPA: hypothetical protein VK327_07030 [Candidatus Paceibacterota bacterium]|nr:hypothetical protein [Candidatus Paceibacterota bacterium]